MQSLLNTLQACGMCNGMDAEVMQDILHAAQLRDIPLGSQLINRDTWPEGLFILHSGDVGIYHEDVLLARLGPPSILGESFIANSVATASILAVTDVQALFFSKDVFFNLSKKWPEIVQNIFAMTVQRLRRSNDKAVEEAHSRNAELQRLVDERTAALNNTLEELRNTQKFRDQFLANMSHEIRTPMNAIVGLTNLLVNSNLDEQQQKYLQVIKKSGDNLLVIINDILDLSKIEAGKMELESVPFSLKQTIDNIRTILSIKAIEKGLTLDTTIGDGVPEYVIGDETRLSQILINLIGNAIKFTPQGSVHIQVALVSKEQDNCAIKFTITDTGIGIPANKLETIFESFGQASSDTTRKFGGTGLGLTISKNLVELHGGTLQVESTVDVGTSFYFTLQYISTQPAATAQESRTANNDELSEKRILLVEDNEFNQMVAHDTIAMQFPEVNIDIAENGRTAIALAAANDYAVILMDIHLPDIDGFAATQFIRKEIPAPRNAVQIIALTASTSKEQLDACLESGMNDFMLKPFTPEELRNKINAAVLRSK